MDFETRLLKLTQHSLDGASDYQVSFTSSRKDGFQATFAQLVGETPYHVTKVTGPTLDEVMTKLEKAHKKSLRARAGIVGSLVRAASRR